MNTEYQDLDAAAEQGPTPPQINFHPLIVAASRIVSILFHPLLVLSYAFLLLAWSDPYAFGHTRFAKVMSREGHFWVFFNLVMFTVAVPLLGMIIMRGLSLIKDINLEDRQDRTGPFILTGLFYIVIYLTINRASAIPNEYKIFILGATIALFMAFFINLFSKISVHSVGMGNFLAIIIVVTRQSYLDNDYIFVLGILACGMVATARRVLTQREPSDIYGGFFIGFLAQFVAISLLHVE